MGSTAKSSGKGANGATSTAQSDPATQLQEIQKLLFGQQIAQVEHAITALRDETRQHIQAFEKSVKASLDKQRKDFSAQLETLNAHVESLNEQHSNREALIEDDIDGVKRSIDTFEKQVDAAHNELEKSLNQESKQLRDEMNAQHEEAMSGLQGNTDTLEQNKVDRQMLADLFSKVAESIRN